MVSLLPQSFACVISLPLCLSDSHLSLPHPFFCPYTVAQGVNIDMRAHNGFSPLSIAAQDGHSMVVERLLYYGADVGAAQRAGATPLYIAARKGHESVVTLLVATGVDLFQRKKGGDVFSIRCPPALPQLLRASLRPWIGTSA